MCIRDRCGDCVWCGGDASTGIQLRCACGELCGEPERCTDDRGIGDDQRAELRALQLHTECGFGVWVGAVRHIIMDIGDDGVVLAVGTDDTEGGVWCGDCVWCGGDASTGIEL